jgi:hypothetical protein
MNEYLLMLGIELINSYDDNDHYLKDKKPGVKITTYFWNMI